MTAGFLVLASNRWDVKTTKHNPRHIPMEAFGWDYTLKMNVCLQFMLPDPLPLARPLPQRAPLTCPFMSTNSLLAVQTFSDSPSPPHHTSDSIWCVMDTQWDVSICVFTYLKGGTVWTHRFLSIAVEMSMLVFLFPLTFSTSFDMKTRVMSRVSPSRQWADTSHFINLTAH